MIFYLTLHWSNQSKFCSGTFLCTKFKFLTKLFFLVATFAMITEKLRFSYFYGNHCQGNKFLYENNETYRSKLHLEKWSQTDIEFSRKVTMKVHIPFLIVMTKTAATGSKYIQSYFSWFSNNICHIPEWILVIFKNHWFFKVPFMTSLNILYSDPHNFLKEATKKLGKYIRNFLCSIKNSHKYFMAHQYLPKIFHGPCKNPPDPPPIYLMYGL